MPMSQRSSNACERACCAACAASASGRMKSVSTGRWISQVVTSPNSYCLSAAVQGRTALGERAGDRDMHAGRGSRDEPFVKAPLCADIDGFSLHAGVVVPAHDRERLEKLCRYAARPAIAESRLSRLPDGRVAYELKRRWKNGTTHVVMEPQVFIERLCALVPRPRKHLVTYHGVLAPAAGLRSRIVPEPASEEDGAGEGDAVCRHTRGGAGKVCFKLGQEANATVPPPRRRRAVPHAPRKLRRAAVRRRYPWAELLKRVLDRWTNCTLRTRSDRSLLHHASVSPVARPAIRGRSGAPNSVWGPSSLPSRGGRANSNCAAKLDESGAGGSVLGSLCWACVVPGRGPALSNGSGGLSAATT